MFNRITAAVSSKEPVFLHNNFIRSRGCSMVVGFTTGTQIAKLVRRRTTGNGGKNVHSQYFLSYVKAIRK